MRSFDGRHFIASPFFIFFLIYQATYPRRIVRSFSQDPRNCRLNRVSGGRNQAESREGIQSARKNRRCHSGKPPRGFSSPPLPFQEYQGLTESLKACFFCRAVAEHFELPASTLLSPHTSKSIVLWHSILSIPRTFIPMGFMRDPF